MRSGFGSERLVSLARAREIARDWRQIAREGGDPAVERDRAKRHSICFEDAARQVHVEQVEPHNRNPKHVAQWISSLETYVFPKIGQRPVHAVDQADILRILAPIWTEKPETARRVKQRGRSSIGLVPPVYATGSARSRESRAACQSRRTSQSTTPPCHTPMCPRLWSALRPLKVEAASHFLPSPRVSAAPPIAPQSVVVRRLLWMRRREPVLEVRDVGLSMSRTSPASPSGRSRTFVEF